MVQSEGLPQPSAADLGGVDSGINRWPERCRNARLVLSCDRMRERRQARAVSVGHAIHLGECGARFRQLLSVKEGKHDD